MAHLPPSPAGDYSLYPSNTPHVVSFNPFQATGGDLSVQVSRRIRLFLRAWAASNTDQAPRMERNMRWFLHVLIERGLSIDVGRFLFDFEEKRLRREIMEAFSQADPTARELNKLNSYKRLEDFDRQVESTWSRLQRFIGPQPIRRIMGLSDNNIDVEEIIEEGKILLVNLQPAAGQLDTEHTRLLGSLLLNEIWEVVERRKQRPGGRTPSPFFLIIDEFQEFLTPDIPKMLNAAKYGQQRILSRGSEQDSDPWEEPKVVNIDPLKAEEYT